MLYNYIFFSCNYKRKNYFHFYQKIYIYHYKIEKYINILYIYIYFKNNIYIYIYLRSTYN